MSTLLGSFHCESKIQNKEQKRQIHLAKIRDITQIKLVKSLLINSTIKFTYPNTDAINLLFLINIFGNNSSEKPHNY